MSDLTFGGGFNIGDTDDDNQLDAGEIWQYTASHTVTQVDIDTLGGGDGFIENTVTADSDQTDPVSATAQSWLSSSAASVEVTKMADVSSADAAGDVINYTVNVTNTGNVTLTGLIVTDPQVSIVTPILDLDSPILGTTPLVAPVFDGDYNIGDTNENGIEDPGETFQYRNVGDENQNGIEDPGETFSFANVGDTNANGVQEAGETFQFYNAGDTNQNGVEDMGETFQFERQPCDRRRRCRRQRPERRRHQSQWPARSRRNLVIHGQLHGDAGRHRQWRRGRSGPDA